MKNSKTLFVIVLAALLAVPAVAYAATSYTKNINVTYGLTVTHNGEPIEWIDSNGKRVDAFTYEDTAYVPLKTLAPLFGSSTEYHYETNSVDIVGNARWDAFILGYTMAMYGQELPEEAEQDLIARGIPLAYTPSLNNYTQPQENNNYIPSQNTQNNYYNESYYNDYSTPDYAFPLHLYSNDGKVYLGKCVTDRFDDKSIWYPLIGDYSSEYSKTSIWNKFSDYGGTLLSYDESAFNDRATNPPMIVDNNGAFVAYLTTNDKIENGWTITELRQFVENNGQ